MKAKEIIKIIENICPERLAYSWDNVGLLCGDENKDVKKVFVTLDTNINTVKEAISKNADMIVSHHPILLGGIKRIDYSTSVGQMLKLLIENNIPLFAAHTNMDTAKGGINDKLAEIFELTDVKILDQHTDDSSAGLGRYGRLEKTIKFGDFAEHCKKILGTPFLRVSGDFEKDINTVAVASGSCSEIIPIAFEKGADGVIMCGCHPGDCHYSTGNYYARRRMTLLFSMLDFIGVENGRTRVEWVSAAEGVKFSTTMNEFVEKIHSLGKNVRLEDIRCRN